MSLPPHEEIFYSKDEIPHPLNLGFHRRFGELKGQLADYGLSLKDGRGIHAVEYDNKFGFHWDKVDPSVNWFEHLRRDSPATYVCMGTLVGAGIGGAIGATSKKKKPIVLSALIFGLLFLFLTIITAEW
jgi:hypothetical protein